MLRFVFRLLRNNCKAALIILILFSYPPILGFAQSSNVNELIISLNESSDPCGAADALGSLKDSQAIEPLIDLIKSHNNKNVQRCAAEALTKIGDMRSVDLLIASLNDEDLIAASRAAFALGIIKDPRAVDGLLKALESNIPCPAAEALGMIKDSSSVGPLIKTLKHDDHSVRSCAAIGLGMIGDPRAIEPLTDIFMQDSDPIARKRARIALKMIKGSNIKEKTQKYSLEDKYCTMCQKLIDSIPLVTEKPTNKGSISKSQQWKDAFTEISEELNRLGPEDPDKSQKLYALVFHIAELSDAVTTLRQLKEQGNIMGANHKLERIDEIKVRLNVLCPDLRIPDNIASDN